MPLMNLRRNIDAIGLNNLILINRPFTLLHKKPAPRLLMVVCFIQRTKYHSSVYA